MELTFKQRRHRVVVSVHKMCSVAQINCRDQTHSTLLALQFYLHSTHTSASVLAALGSFVLFLIEPQSLGLVRSTQRSSFLHPSATRTPITRAVHIFIDSNSAFLAQLRLNLDPPRRVLERRFLRSAFTSASFVFGCGAFNSGSPGSLHALSEKKQRYIA